MSAWLRGNRWYLIALAVVLPVAVLVSLIPRWFPYQERQPRPEAVALGETVRYGGADIRLTELEVLDGAEVNGPAGADIVVATISVDVVEPASSYCTVRLVSTEHGLERWWDPELFIDSDFEVDDRYEQTCVLSEAGDYELQLTYLVPRGQVAEPVVELSSAADLPRVLRLS